MSRTVYTQSPATPSKPYVHITPAQKRQKVQELLARYPGGVTLTKCVLELGWTDKSTLPVLQQLAGEALAWKKLELGTDGVRRAVWYARQNVAFAPHLHQRTRAMGPKAAEPALPATARTLEFKPLNVGILRTLIRHGAGGPAMPGVRINPSVYDLQPGQR